MIEQSLSNPRIAALMIEAFIVDGNQEFDKRPLIYGKSVTDKCISFEKTASLLAWAHEKRSIV